MERVRVGVIGAGLIAQVEHVPNLLRLKHLFELVGICDPSAMARAAMTKRHGLAAFETPEQLLGQKLDALPPSLSAYLNLCVADLSAAPASLPLCHHNVFFSDDYRREFEELRNFRGFGHLLISLRIAAILRMSLPSTMPSTMIVPS